MALGLSSGPASTAEDVIEQAVHLAMQREEGITREYSATGTERGHGIAGHRAFLLVQLAISAEVDPPEGQHNSDWIRSEPKHSTIGTNYIPTPIRLEWRLGHDG
ncbi:hypothetical protein BB934_40450 (plasmid) [Microvirga ossetica]|uniref:Uncharacterized protein n=1 Tax=Microvirga ossetica TaxID=1882682 RepID=A0A1B2EWX7_9HYPH|nr:hypothetical protein BB934_40450 [Microvirga ossetica]